MPSETDANDAQTPVALGHCSHMVQQRARVVIVGCKLFCELIVIALVRAGLVISEHSSSRLKLVVHLRHSNQIAMPGKERGKATNRSGHLEDLGIEDDAGELLAFNSGTEKIGPHRTVGCGNLLNEIVFEDHVPTLRDSVALQDRVPLTNDSRRYKSLRRSLCCNPMIHDDIAVSDSWFRPRGKDS